MDYRELTLERWEAVTPAERETLARRLARELPTGFTFRSIETFRLGTQSHPVALFGYGDATFALLPGGPVTLGYDPDRPWEPTPEERASWNGYAEEYGGEESLKEFIAEVTRRPRRVELPALLVETTTAELGWDPIGEDDPAVQEIMREYGVRGQTEVWRGEVGTRVRRGPDGRVIAQRSTAVTHADLAAWLRAGGFRFPNSEEWEYACGGGADTLYRWGDHAPADRYPNGPMLVEGSPAWRRWMAECERNRTPGRFPPDWEEHRKPNAFGLYIASDPYRYELVAEPYILRGGDGGCSICGGYGFVIGWLPLATAYFEEHYCARDPEEAVEPGFTFGRRVLELS